MARSPLFALTLATAMLASGAALAQSSVSAMSSTLTASPRLARGPCPAVITFDGRITVRGTIDPRNPVQIGYQFLRSDGATAPINYYTITAPGTNTVSTTWTLGSATALPTYRGWQQLKAWPTHHEGGFGYSFSNKAQFSVVCRR